MGKSWKCDSKRLTWCYHFGSHVIILLPFLVTSSQKWKQNDNMFPYYIRLTRLTIYTNDYICTNDNGQ